MMVRMSNGLSSRSHALEIIGRFRAIAEAVKLAVQPSYTISYQLMLVIESVAMMNAIYHRPLI